MTDRDIEEGRRLLLGVPAAPRASASPGEPVGGAFAASHPSSQRMSGRCSSHASHG